jgi:hypothetical protein
MSRHKLEDDIQNGVKGVGWEGFDWIILTQFREKWRALCEQCNEIPGSLKCGVFLVYTNFSRKTVLHGLVQ